LDDVNVVMTDPPGKAKRIEADFSSEQPVTVCAVPSAHDGMSI
jgi:hypothetical protein